MPQHVGKPVKVNSTHGVCSSVSIQYTVVVDSFRLFASFVYSHRRCQYLTRASMLVATADRAKHCYHPRPNGTNKRLAKSRLFWKVKVIQVEPGILW
jgi:hypothetical protein